jgi:hypothetical protein
MRPGKNDQLRMLGKFEFSRHQVVIQSDARTNPRLHGSNIFLIVK